MDDSTLASPRGDGDGSAATAGGFNAAGDHAYAVFLAAAQDISATTANWPV